jgi:hypothetical protein
VATVDTNRPTRKEDTLSSTCSRVVVVDDDDDDEATAPE